MGEDSALEEGVELVFDELRQVGAGSVFGPCAEGLGVLKDQAVQRGLLLAMTIAVNRCAIQRQPGRPVDGLHSGSVRVPLAKWLFVP